MSGSRFQGQIVVVTGASGGLGANIVAAFAAEGARVIAADINPPAELPGLAVHRRLDVTDEDAWIALLDEIGRAHV